MRELTMSEMTQVAGAGDGCPGEAGSGNDFGGVSNTEKLAEDLINIYEGLVAATSHVIERVANAL